MCGRDLSIDGFKVSAGSSLYDIEDVEIREHLATNCHYDFFSTKVRLRTESLGICLLQISTTEPLS